MKPDNIVNVAIICSGPEGIDIASTLIDCPSINVVGLCGADPSFVSKFDHEHPGILLSEHIDSLYADHSDKSIDIIINVGDKSVDGLSLSESTETISGKGIDVIKSLTRDYKTVNGSLKAILNSGKAIASKKDSKGIYGSILQNAIKITESDVGSLIVFDEKTDVCRLVEVAGYPEKFTGECSWELRPDGFSENLLESEEPLFVSDINDDTSFDNPAMSEGTISVLGTTLKESDDVIGFLYVGNSKKRLYGKDETTLFSILADQASLALQKALLLEKNEELTIVDSLSGLYNPRHFFDTLEAEVRRVQRYGGSFSVMGMDIDNLGYINNQFGHNKGDWVVRKVSDIIVTCTRQTDYKARYGGDEFALILPSTNYHQASILANRIKREVNEILLDNSVEQIRLSVSIGIAEFPSLGPDSTSLLTAVNTALTVCKQRGRNLVCCYEETDCASG